MTTNYITYKIILIMAHSLDFAKMNIKQLKEELRRADLPLSGKKETLLSRLKSHYGINQSISLNYSQYETMTVNQLKTSARELKLSTSGKKAELIDRLNQYTKCVGELSNSITGSRDIDIEVMLLLDDRSLNCLCRSNKYYLYICKDSSGYFWKRRLENEVKYKFPLSSSTKYNYKKIYDLVCKQSIFNRLKISAQVGDVGWVKAVYKQMKEEYVGDTGQSSIEGLMMEPIKEACCEGHLPIIQYFVEDIVIDPYWAEESVSMALIYAAGKGQLHIVQYLVKFIISCIIKSGDNIYDNHALEYAVCNGHLPIVLCIMAHSLELRADLNTIPIWYIEGAAKRGHWPTVRYVLEHAEDAHWNVTKLLRTAITKGNLEMVKYLMEVSSNINVDKMRGLAAKKGKEKILDYLKLL
jgi:ankyrin repeat protein